MDSLKDYFLEYQKEHVRQALYELARGLNLSNVDPDIVDDAVEAVMSDVEKVLGFGIKELEQATGNDLGHLDKETYKQIRWFAMRSSVYSAFMALLLRKMNAIM